MTKLALARWWFAAALAATLAGCGPQGPANPAAEQAAVKAAATWLATLDAGNYTGSWQNSATYFRGAVPVDEWVRSMQAYRAPLGTNLTRRVSTSRYVTSLPGAPDGQYVLIQYDAAFAHKQAGIETVTTMADTDGVWRVSGYFIK